MKSLYLDTASRFLFVAIREKKILYTKQVLGQNNHSELLLNNVKLALDKLKLQAQDLTEIIIGIGPGSYTGLRVSLTLAKMFAWSLNIPLYTISSLSLALSGYTNKDGIYLAKQLAKREHHYIKIIEIKDKKITIIQDDAFVKDSEMEELINKYPNITIINEEDFLYDASNIDAKSLTKVEDIYLLEPNYLRGVL